MCLAKSSNLLLVLKEAPKCNFNTNSWSSGQQKKRDAKTLFFHLPFPFHSIFLQMQQYWHLYCFAILGSTSTVIYSVKQCLLRNQPKSDATTSHDFLRERLQRAFTCANQLHWTAQCCRCPLLQTARQTVGPWVVQLHTKLYSSKEEPVKTATLTFQTGLSVLWRSRRRLWYLLKANNISPGKEGEGWVLNKPVW